MLITQFNLYKNMSFYKYAHNPGQKKSPDMILTAFHMEFHERKDEIPPKARKPQKLIPEIPKITRMHEEMDPSTAPPGGAAPREKRKRGYEPRHTVASPKAAKAFQTLIALPKIRKTNKTKAINLHFVWTHWPIYTQQTVLRYFGGVIQVQNSISRRSVLILKGEYEHRHACPLFLFKVVV